LKTYRVRIVDWNSST